MISNQRRFIRLEEIPEKTALTKGDVLNAIDTGKLSFLASIDTKNVGAVLKSKKDKSWSVGAVFDYKGLVQLTGSVSQQFASKLDTYQANKLLIIQPEKIQNWKAVPEVFSNLEQSYMAYSMKAPAQPTENILVCAKVEAVPTTENQVGKMASFIGDITSSFLPDANLGEMREKFPKNDSMCLKAKSIEIEPEHLRLDLQDIANLFGQDAVKGANAIANPKPNDLVKEVESNQISIANKVIYTHPIQEVIANVLAQQSKLNSRQIWNIVKEDVNTDARQFDTESIIDEMTNDDLVYFGLKDTTKTLSYRRFQNLISEVKKNLHG